MLTYFLVLLPFVISPGASYALTIASVEKRGFAGTRDVITGTVLGIFVHALLAAVGISTFMMGIPYFRDLIIIIGSLILIYLGVSIGISLFKPINHKKDIITIKKVFMLNLFNIKPILLYLTVLPSFIYSHENINVYMYYVYFGTAHIVLQIGWLLLLGYIVSIVVGQKLKWIIKLLTLSGCIFLILLGSINFIDFMSGRL